MNNKDNKKNITALEELLSLSSPAELLKYMNIINYGFVDQDGKKYNATDEYFEQNVFNKWHLSSPKRLLRVKHGNCFDQVELERAWFTKYKFKIHTYYLMFLLPYENPFSMHTFLVYEDNHKYYLFEHSDYNNRGIHEYNSLKELLEEEKNRQIKYNKEKHKMSEEEQNSIAFYEYQKPKYNLTMEEFINDILEHGKKIEKEKI